MNNGGKIHILPPLLNFSDSVECHSRTTMLTVVLSVLHLSLSFVTDNLFADDVFTSRLRRLFFEVNDGWVWVKFVAVVYFVKLEFAV